MNDSTSMILLDEEDRDPPKFISNEDTIMLPESPVGSLVTVARYDDSDRVSSPYKYVWMNISHQGENAAAVFEIVDGDPKNNFRIGVTSGVLYTNKVMNHTDSVVYSLNISLLPFTGKHGRIFK